MSVLCSAALSARANLTFDPDPLLIQDGEIYTIEVTGRDTLHATIDSAEVFSSDPTILRLQDAENPGGPVGLTYVSRGKWSFRVIGISSGTASNIVRDSEGNLLDSLRVTVELGEELEITPASTSLMAGESGTMTVTRSRSNAAGGDDDGAWIEQPLTVSLRSANPAVATVPANKTIPAGATSASFEVTGVDAGTTTLTATAQGHQPASASVNVGVPSLEFVPDPVSLPLDGERTLELTRPASQADNSLDVTLRSSNTGIFSAPETVTFPAGATRVSFTATGISLSGAAPAQLRAQVAGLTLAEVDVYVYEHEPVLRFVAWRDTTGTSLYDPGDMVYLVFTNEMQTATVTLDHLRLYERDNNTGGFEPHPTARWGAGAAIEALSPRLFRITLGSDARIDPRTAVKPTPEVRDVFHTPDATPAPLSFPDRENVYHEGIADWWFFVYDLDPRRPDAAYDDPDGDALSNWAEYRAWARFGGPAALDPRAYDTFEIGLSDYDRRVAPDNPDSPTVGHLFNDWDGMADLWEFRHGLDLDSYDGHRDLDGDGWRNYAEFMAGTDPEDPTDFPRPTLRFQVDVPDANTPGTIVVQVYSSAAMDSAPDATFHLENNTSSAGMRIFEVHEPASGSVREGDAWFFAFLDRDGNDTWNPDSEPAAIAEYRPINLSWGTVGVPLSLRDEAFGFPRVAWPSANAETQIRILWGNDEILFEKTLSANRHFLHEGDLIHLSPDSTWYDQRHGLTVGGVDAPRYTWIASREGREIASGDFRFAWSEDGAASRAPIRQQSPAAGGTASHSLVEFTWTMDLRNTAVQFELRRDSASGASVINRVFPLPRNPDASGENGLYSLRPQLVDRRFLELPDGNYVWRISTSTPCDSTYFDQTSGWREVTLNRQSRTDGPFRISGQLHYFGLLSDAPVTVQAFRRDTPHVGPDGFVREGFGGYPAAQTTVSSALQSFTLRGLPRGTYFLRAFIDQTGTGTPEIWSTRGYLFDPDADDPFAERALRAIAVGPDQAGLKIVLRDRMTNNNYIPDSWEYARVGNLTTLTRAHADWLNPWLGGDESTGMSPSGFRTLVTRRPTFQWPARSGATWYQVWVHRNGTTYRTHWVQGERSWTPDVSLHGGEYQWWVRPWSPAEQYGDWSLPAFFRIAVQPPAPPRQLTPEGETDNNAPTFRWPVDSNADWYQLWVSHPGGGAWHNRWYDRTETGEGEAAVTLAAHPGGASEWWLRAWNPDGMSDWEGPMRFSTPSPDPAQPSGLEAVGEDAGVRFSWNPDEKSQWFRLWIQTGAGELVFDDWTRDSSWSLSDLNGAEYHWWVGAWNDVTRRTVWSEKQSFSR